MCARSYERCKTKGGEREREKKNAIKVKHFLLIRNRNNAWMREGEGERQTGWQSETETKLIKTKGKMEKRHQ